MQRPADVEPLALDEPAVHVLDEPDVRAPVAVAGAHQDRTGRRRRSRERQEPFGGAARPRRVRHVLRRLIPALDDAGGIVADRLVGEEPEEPVRG